VSDSLAICLVCPYALNGSHPVAEHVRQAATALAGRGHRVTVLAPSASTQALRSGRRRLRALAEGDPEALHAMPGETLAVAVGPTVLGHRRRKGLAIPVAANANVATAVGEGGFDVVDAHEPHLPGIGVAAIKHARALTVATFHTTVERTFVGPIRESRRERYRARIDALIATSERAASLAQAIYPGDYRILPSPIDEPFQPAAKAGASVVVAWSHEARPVVRALVRLCARMPEMTLTVLWNRDGRRPIRPSVPAEARGRVHVLGTGAALERAAALVGADVLVLPPDAGGDTQLAWEARACGCAIVSPDGNLGLAYAIDQPALAAAATARLLDDQALRDRLAAEGQSAVAPRRPAELAQQLEDVYRGLIARRRINRLPRPAGRTAIHADLHMHTSHSYDCATDVEQLVDHCIAMGFGAIAITDHNEISGALAARDLGKPITVIVGEEVMTSQGEVIGLFLEERIERGMSMADTIGEIQRQGGLVLMPHPFDRLHTIPDAGTLHRLLDSIDIFEVYNSRLMFDSFNQDALRFAGKYNLVQSAGSDAHVLQGIGTAINRIPAFDGAEEFLVSMRHNEILRRPKSLLYLQGLKWVHQVSKTGS
jgi:predicted metal-dependent phosphoesterase TrpH/glycosyltransferase involved in cell wall biosynthesis